MKFRLSIAAVMACLAGCNTVPDKPDFSMSVNGNYKAVADCAYLSFRDLDHWQRQDLDTMNKVEFALTNGTSTAGRIYVEADGPDRSRIVSYVQAAIWGKDYWPNRYRPIFQKCAR